MERSDSSALIAGYLSKDVEHYGLLKVTEEGHKFLKRPKSFKITEDNDFEETKKKFRHAAVAPVQ